MAKSATATPTAGARRDWSAQTESASLAQAQRVMRKALAAFKDLRNPALQMRLAREAAFTRASELTLAYANVVMLSAGYKFKTLRSGQQRLQRLPCVVFVVRRKWSAAANRDSHPQRLPAGLLVYVEHDGVRRVVAVPTDVQDESSFFGARSQAERALYVDTDDKFFGALTCAVEVSGAGPPKRYVMSALHVLSPRPALDSGTLASGLRASRMMPAVPPARPPTLATSTAFGGRLRSQGNISFDVQLAEAVSWPSLAPLLADMPLSAMRPGLMTVEAFEDLPPGQRFELLVPDNHPSAEFKPRPAMVAEFLNYMPSAFPISYAVRLGQKPDEAHVHHWQLLKLRLLASRQTLPGDSGSPLVLWNDDGSCTLVGMHIAGDAGLSYVIPSWRLFDLGNYWKPPPGKAMRPVNP